MRKKFHFETNINKLLLLAPATWMLQMPGEGESGIKSQGRFWYSLRFSQETKAIGQQALEESVYRPKLERELSAGMRVDSDSTPHLFFAAAMAATQLKSSLIYGC